MTADKTVNLCGKTLKITETLQVMSRLWKGKVIFMKERYHVTGMSCSACSSHVEKAVNKLENVEKASVNLLTETMDVTYDETKITSTEIIDAVVKAGYGASVMTEGSAAGAGGQSTSGNAGSTGRSVADGKQELQQKLDADARAMKWRLGISIGFLIPLHDIFPSQK